MKLGSIFGAVAVSILVGCGGGADGVGSGSAELATVCPQGGTVEGIDVSEFQGAIDWAAVRASGRVFAIARVSDGTQHLDPTFASNYAALKAQGMVRGSYQFFRASQDPIAQADLLLSQIGALGAGDLPPMLDVEVTDGQTNATIDAHIAAWVAHVKAATGRDPLVYTGPYFWGEIGEPASAGTTLVVADWGPSCPLIPSAWSGWSFWQYADNGHVAGIGGLVDLDRFDGSEAELRALTGAGASDSDVPSPADYVGIASTADGDGYWIAKGDGGMFSFGDAQFLGSMGGTKLAGPVVGIAGTKSGYWLVGDDGGVFAFGNAFYGSMGGKALNAPVAGIAATPSGKGYWLVAKDGGIFAFGDAGFYGSMGGKPLNAPVTGIAPRPQGDGYWLVAKDGGVFAFGAAGFHGRP